MISKNSFKKLTNVIATVTVLGYCALTSSSLQAATIFTSDTSSPAIEIPDNGENGTLAGFITNTINVSGHGLIGTIADISIDVGISHSFIGDLKIMIESPEGDFLGLMSRPGINEPGDGTGCCGNGSDWLGTTETWSIAGNVDPENMSSALLGVGTAWAASPQSMVATYGSLNSMSDLLGSTANGNWTLYVSDAASLDTGSLDSWSLNITTVSTPSIALIAILGACGMFARRRRIK